MLIYLYPKALLCKLRNATRDYSSQLFQNIETLDWYSPDGFVIIFAAFWKETEINY